MWMAGEWMSRCGWAVTHPYACVGGHVIPTRDESEATSSLHVTSREDTWRQLHHT